MRKFPTAVPLTELGPYADDVVFGNLALPVGFPQEKLHINVRAFHRERIAVGLGPIAIVGEAGEAGAYDYDVTSLDSSGVATFGAVSKRPKKKLSAVELDFPYSQQSDHIESEYGNPEVSIHLNGAEIRARLQEQTKRYPEGEFSAKGYARIVNRAVGVALAEASIKANVDQLKTLETVQSYGWASLLAAGVVGVGNIPSHPLLFLSTTVAAAVATREARAFGDGDLPHKDFRHSLFAGCAFDRSLAGIAIARTHRFVRAAKG